MYADIFDKYGKPHIGKNVQKGKCVFPYKYRKKEYSTCLDTGKGGWCPTKLTNKGFVDKWGYCIDKDIYKASNILSKKLKYNLKTKKYSNNELNIASTILTLKNNLFNTKLKKTTKNNNNKKLSVHMYLSKVDKGFKIKTLENNELNNNMGRMVYKGPFGGSISYHGLPLDILKSGIQKYIRRGKTDKALWCAIEYDLFRKVGAKTNGILTNMLNRLYVTCVEDIGIANINTILYLDEQMDIYFNNRNDFSDYKVKESLINVITCLSESKKIRLFSHIRATYMTPENYSVLKEKYPKLYENINYINPVIENKYQLKNTKEESDLRLCVDKIITCLYSNNDQIFYHIKQFLLKVSKEIGYKSRFRKKSGEYILWEIIIEYCKNGIGICGISKTNEYQKYLPYLETLLKWYKTRNNSRNENIIYLVNAYLIILRKIDIDKIPTNIPLKIREKDNYISIIDKIYNRDKSIILDDYIVDMHTKIGRTLGMNKKDFGSEGSKVVNEEILYKNELYNNIYLLFKNNSASELKKEISNSKKKVKVVITKKLKFDGDELKTSELLEHNIIKNPLLVNVRPKFISNDNKFVHVGGRPSTYYAKFILKGYKHENVLVKGPYPNNEITDSIEYSCMIDNLKPYLGLNKIGCKIVTMKPTLQISYGVSETEPKKFIVFKDFGSGVDTYNRKTFINSKKQDTKIEIYDKNNSNQMVKWLINNKIENNTDILSQLVYVLLFRQIIETSDTNLTNILIDNNQVLSIDENLSPNFDNKIIFSHHQKKELSDVIDVFIRNNLDGLISKLNHWKEVINSTECMEMMNRYTIFKKYKWNPRLINNIESLKNILNNNLYKFK